MKVYLISSRSGGSSRAMTHAEPAEFMGVPCLKGTSRYVGQYEWYNGTAVYVPSAEIGAITEFASVAEYDAAMRLSDAREQRTKRRRSVLWGVCIVAYLIVIAAAVVQGYLHPRH